MEHNDIPNDLILKLNEVTVDMEKQNYQYDKLFREIADPVHRAGIDEEVVRNWNFKLMK